MEQRKQFIDAASEQGFDTALQAGKVSENQVAFIEKEKKIWARGVKYDGSSPEQDDFDKSNGVFKLKDRPYEPQKFSGKGYKILRKNIVDGKNILTQEMINEANTVYEIRYDYDLDNKEITIPENCCLKFEGGNLYNGTINYNNAKILNSNISIVTDKLNLGYYNKYYVNVLEFYNGETDWGLVINKAIKYASEIGICEVFMPHGTYEVNTTIVVENGVFLTGEYSWKENTRTCLKLANNANKTLLSVKANSSSTYGHGLKNITIDGNWNNQQSYNDVVVITGFVGTSIENVFIVNCKGSALSIGDSADFYIKNVWILYVETENYNDGAVKFITSSYGGTLYVTNLYVEWVYYSNRILYATAIKVSKIASIQLNHVHIEYCNIGFDIQSSQLININDVTVAHVKSLEDSIGSVFYLGMNRTIVISSVNTYNLDEDCYLIKTDNIVNNQYYSLKEQRYLTLWIGTGYNENEKLNGAFISKVDLSKPTIKKYVPSDSNYEFSELKYITEKINGDNLYKGSVKFNQNSFIIEFTPANIDKFNILECSVNPNNNPNNNYIRIGKPLILTNNNTVGNIPGQIVYNNDTVIYRGEEGYTRYIIGKKYNTNYGSSRPLNKDIGDSYFDTTLNKPIWWNGTNWVDKDGNNANFKSQGTFAEKPSNPPTGFAYFCTDRQTVEGSVNGIMIYYKGDDAWVDALGRVVS